MNSRDWFDDKRYQKTNNARKMEMSLSMILQKMNAKNF